MGGQLTVKHSTNLVVWRPIAGNSKMSGLARQLEQIKTIAPLIKARGSHADAFICAPSTPLDRGVQASLGYRYHHRHGIGGGAQGCGTRRECCAEAA